MSPLKIETNIPLPQENLATHGIGFELRSALARMSPGDSFVFRENRSPFRAAQQIGARITTRKLDGQGYRVWLIGHRSPAPNSQLPNS
jgi:hypothetical protein